MGVSLSPRPEPNPSGSHGGAALALVALPVALLAAVAFFPLLYLAWHLASAFSGWGDVWMRVTSSGVATLLRFTLWQALWSTALSIGCAFPVAWALAGRRFPGRRLLLGLSVVPFALPSVVVAFAFVIVYGNSGYLAPLFSHLGLEGSLLYNRWAVVAAHVFFNLPFCTRALVVAWESIPRAQLRSATALGFSHLQRLRHVEIPHLLKPAANVSLLTFGYCLGSFGVVLVLGGRPEVSTLEVGIYQLIRYDFDVQGAAVLAGLQLLLTLSAALIYRLSLRGAPRVRHGAGENRRGWPPWPLLVPLGLYVLFLGLPLSGIVGDGLRHVPRVWLGNGMGWGEVSRAFATSVGLAGGCALFSAVLALLLARGTIAMAPVWPWAAFLLQESVWVLVGVSPTVMAFCWLLLLQGNPFSQPLLAIFAVHVAGTLPLSLRVVLPPLERVLRDSSRSADMMGFSVMKRLWYVEIRAMRGPLSLAAMAAFAYSFGEVAAASVFGGGGVETIPLLVFRLMGAYRFADAALLSLLLALVCAGVAFFSEEL